MRDAEKTKEEEVAEQEEIFLKIVRLVDCIVSQHRHLTPIHRRSQTGPIIKYFRLHSFLMLLLL